MDDTLAWIPQADTGPSPKTLGGGRFQLLRRLGAGGMGIVYEAIDLERNHRLALKTLLEMNPTALLRFKNEFRSLTEITHPGLVQLHEFIADGNDWFFIMELVDGGVDLLAYLSDQESHVEIAPRIEETRPVTHQTPSTVPDSLQKNNLGEGPLRLTRTDPFFDMDRFAASPGTLADEPGATEPTFGPAATDFGRVRMVFSQLAEAVRALHAHGKLHRDIKPSNALVTPEGRVVLLDFGLVADTTPSREPPELLSGGNGNRGRNEWLLAGSQSGQIVGTVNYMSPEQGEGKPLGQASDWYSVGVILYQALTGRLPHRGVPKEVLEGKRTLPPIDPARLAAGAPAELCALCRDLLKIDPAERPTGEEVLRRLGTVAHSNVTPQSVPFVGRTSQLAALDEAFSTPVARGAVVVGIRGPSGSGKTALVSKFLEGIAADDSVVVLAGRCYEQESVPYKAIDSLIDSLSRDLLKRSREGDVRFVSPGPDAAALARIFPVLLRVPGFDDARLGVTTEGDDPQAIRTRALRALRQILSRLADLGRLVLFIDDVQWGDADSVSLLSSVLESPTNSRMILLIAYRAEYRETSSCIVALRNTVLSRSSPGFWGEVEVGALEADESIALTRKILGSSASDRDDLTERVARASGGNPLFVWELARQLRDRPADENPDAGCSTDLDEVLWQRVCRLNEDTRRLLETLAVAGRPITRSVARTAAAIVDDGRMLAELRAEHFLRSTGPRPDDELTVFHDRVRESILSRLPSETLRDHHSRLAEVLEATGTQDVEILADHHHQAGNLDRALTRYVAAAEQAVSALAFDRAVGLYRKSLKIAGPLGADLRPLRECLADALGNLGHGPESAAEYLAASEGTGAEATLRLKQKAAFQYCISGHVDEGRAAFREVLRAVGVSMPDRPLFAATSVLALRFWLRFRGLRFSEHASSEDRRAELDRIDTLRSVSVGISVVDPMVGAYFQTRGTLLALKAGEPLRAALALAWEAAHHSLSGAPARPMTDRLLAAASEAASRTDQPQANAMVQLAQGISFFMEGRYRKTWECSRPAAETFDTKCVDVAWERDTSKLFTIWGFLFSGDYLSAREASAGLYRECVARGDRYMMTNLGTQVNTLLTLANGSPDEAARNLDSVMAEWTRVGFNVQHHGAAMARSYIALYRGDGLEAWRDMRSFAVAYHTSLLTRCQQIRADRTAMEARAAVAAYRQTGSSTWLRAAERRARRLDAEGLPWTIGMGAQIHACIALTRGDSEKAVHHLRRAVAAFEDAPMAHLAAVSRFHLGKQLGTESGRVESAAAAEWFTKHAIGDPGRFAAMWVPGF